MKDSRGREVKVFLVEREDRITRDPRFIPVCVILAEDWDRAAEVAQSQLGLRLIKYPTFRKGNAPYAYRMSMMEVVENNNPLGLGLNEMVRVRGKRILQFTRGR